MPPLRPSPRNSLASRLEAFHSDESGQGMTEYIIILIAIAVVCGAINVAFGEKLKRYWDDALVETSKLTP